METAAMESDVPPTEPHAPVDPVPAAPESAHERHTREFNQSVGTLEDTVEHGLVRMLKLAIPILMGVVLAAIGMYILGNRLRDRAERRRVARAVRRARSPKGRRARARQMQLDALDLPAVA
jgi:hypothetical protein